MARKFFLGRRGGGTRGRGRGGHSSGSAPSYIHCKPSSSHSSKQLLVLSFAGPRRGRRWAIFKRMLVVAAWSRARQRWRRCFGLEVDNGIGEALAARRGAVQQRARGRRRVVRRARASPRTSTFLMRVGDVRRCLLLLFRCASHSFPLTGCGRHDKQLLYAHRPRDYTLLCTPSVARRGAECGGSVILLL